MGGFLPESVPKFQRCCFCTRKLRVACIFIAIWSLFALAHSMRILFCPACVDLYTKEGGYLYKGLIIMMWILFVINVGALCSSFAYLLSLFLHIYPVTADVYMGLSTLSALGMFVHGILNLIQIFDGNCNNPSDTFAHFMYFGLWAYFILIVNSHRDEIGEAFFGGGGSESFSSCYVTGNLIYLSYLGIALAILLFISIIFFIFGVITEYPLAVLCFMYASLFWLIYNIAVSVVLFSEMSEGNCSPPYFLASATLLSSIVILYFLVVISSYYRKMPRNRD